MASHTHKPHLEKHQILKGVNIEDLELTNNRVLCKKITHNIEDGVNGILYPKQFNQNQYLNQNVDRVYEVVKIPKSLIPERWETKIEIKKGDWVWVTQTDALNAPDIIDVNGDEYRLLRYTALIVAKRKKAIIPLNGRIILSNIFANRFDTKGTELIMRPYIEFGLAKVEYVGEPLQSYLSSNETDEGIDVKCGDIVILELVNKNLKSMNRNYLEEEMFAVFDDKKKKYFYEQRRNILGILENVIDTK
jgi:hypothetical protein